MVFAESLQQSVSSKIPDFTPSGLVMEGSAVSIAEGQQLPWHLGVPDPSCASIVGVLALYNDRVRESQIMESMKGQEV